jgi:hypothetical protein
MAQKVPFWGQLSADVQNKLTVASYGHDWFDTQSDGVRLTVLNLYVKLTGMDNLWRFVQKRDSTPVGCLEFLSSNVEALKQALGRRSDFTTPDSSATAWETREKRATYALHFKHFQGWPQGKVQAHIDKIGLYAGGKDAPDISPVVMGIPHLIDYCRHGWADVFAIREGLLQQGWYKAALSGINATWICGSRSCPSHSQPEHRCVPGTWFCGSVSPPCPGTHKSADERCAGTRWKCGARACPSHSRPEHVCPSGVWFCGRKQPACPGHSTRNNPCDSDAAIIYPR